MSDERNHQRNQAPDDRQPAILLPGVVTALLGLMLAVHLARAFVLNEQGDEQLYLWLAFVPVRAAPGFALEGGWIPLLWTPFTHAFLHAGWEHLLVNCAWLAIFGTPVARRYGPRATVILFLASAAVGAAAFAATTFPEFQVLIGASGGVAGLTGVACRFIFQPVIVGRDPDTGTEHVLGRRMASLGELMRNQRAAFFIVIWLVLNAAVPFLPMLIGQSIGIAWQAHLGGFLAGLFLTPLFERRPEGSRK
ncbi:MAG TPA: rhomboid family intramembrane serine protease [Devosia sp.]|jgi:membrane associated rhomboid family serine protease|uniref:rhomboid family intramembrane serine protease n=1 Tax=Devosia sp. TaxID=1871048 RepID=UPI002DDCC20D|nr:rhomboid family intramembrane serine protease [Devosia sp.]HEV2515532.1 rhomboid family intramembrane serine protease [Devosia sp.]